MILGCALNASLFVPHLAVKRMITKTISGRGEIKHPSIMDVAHNQHIHVTQEDVESFPIHVPSVSLITGH